jgi:GNAT superfamily N-acetyltransferase
LDIQPVVTRRDLKRFVTFPWRIYRNDPNWVPPLIAGQLDKLTPGRNPFWDHAERALWLVLDAGRPAGTIAAILDHAGNRALGQTAGSFGFFECMNDPAAARLLFDTAADWLAERGMTAIRGPYSPGGNDEPGLLVTGYDTRPALMEGHNPPYYIELVEAAGFRKQWDTVAWLSIISPEARRIEDVLPPKLLRTAQWAANRSQARLRPVDIARWEAEVSVACEIYNAALADLPNNLPFPEPEFQQLAASFKPLVDRDLAFFAEVNSVPVAFAITLPDLNEALQHVNGRLGPIGLAKLWWHSRHLHRATFKMLMIRPEFRGRGLETLLITETARVIFARGYREVDMSLTGEDNENMQRMMAGMEMKVYRRYRVYEKTIDDRRKPKDE